MMIDKNTKECIISFVRKGYKHYSYDQCIARLILTCLISTLPYFFGGMINTFWLWAAIAFDILFICLNILFAILFHNMEILRFLGDGIFLLKISIISIFTTYKIIMKNEEDSLLLICIFGVAAFFSWLFLLIVKKYVFKGSYINSTSSYSSAAFATFGAVIGIFTIKYIKSNSPSLYLILNNIAPFFLVIVFSILATLCFYKAYLFNKLDDVHIY